MMTTTGLFLIMLAAACRPLQAATTIAIQIDAPAAMAGVELPLYCGVPFPRGQLHDPNLVSLTDKSGQTMPLQRRVMSCWPGDNSIRWLGVDFTGDPHEKYLLHTDADLAKESPSPVCQIEVSKEGDRYRLTTGPACFYFTDSGPLLAEILLDINGDGKFTTDEQILKSGQGELYAIDHQGRTAWSGCDAEPDRLEFEPPLAELQTAGAVLHLTVRREGWYSIPESGERLARHITRLHFYAGQPWVRLEHTLILTRCAIPGSAADRRPPDSLPPLWFKEIGVRLHSGFIDGGRILFANNGDKPLSIASFDRQLSASPLYMFQRQAAWFERIDPESDYSFTIGSEDGTILHEGKRCGDWAALQGSRVGLALGVRHMWQQFPKELHVAGDGITARLWSPRGGDELDFRLENCMKYWPTNWFNHALHGDYGGAWKNVNESTRGDAIGMAKSHELLLFPHAASIDDSKLARAFYNFSRPAVALSAPDWLYASEAMSPVYPLATNRFPLAEGLMATFFEQYHNVMEQWGDYGFLHFGGRPHVAYRYLRQKDHPLDGRWIPLLHRYSPMIDYGFSGHLWRMYARSGQRCYLDLAETASRNRMDNFMVHWEEPGLNVTNQPGFLYGKFKGAYSSALDLHPWSPYSIMHHYSGTDLRPLYWHYYLLDYRRALDVAESYRELVHRFLAAGAYGPFRGTRPFAVLKNLAVLYQETGDPDILELGHINLELMCDPDSHVGLSQHLEPGLGKYSVKIGAIERWYEATGDELAARAILRSAETYARTSLGNPTHSYYNIFARVLNRAYRISGDPLYARILKRNMELAIERSYDFDQNSWGNTLDPVVVAAYTPYQLGDMAIGMDAIVRAGQLGPVPLLQQNGQGRPILAICRKSSAEAIRLDIRSRVPLKPQVFTSSGEAVSLARIEPFRWSLDSLEPVAEPASFMVELPADVPDGDYLIDPGVGGAPWEITWSDARSLVCYAPGGIAVNGGPPWYFHVPRGCSSFMAYNAAEVPLYRPDGTRVAANATQRWERITVPTGADNCFWRLQPRRNNAFCELRGLPPLFVCDTNHWFAPEVTQLPLARFDMLADYAPLEQAHPIEAEDGPLVAGITADVGGLSLGGRRALVIEDEAVAELLDPESGTLEFWLRPNWSNVYGTKMNYVLSAAPWSIVLNYMQPRQALMRTSQADGQRLDINCGVTLERGRWYHLAWQWQTAESGVLQLEMFVDGQLCGRATGSVATGGEGNKKGAGVSAVLIFGHHQNRPPGWGSLDGVVSSLRFSSGCRYTAGFTPATGLAVDHQTRAFFAFKRGVTGVDSSGRAVKASLP